MVERARLRSAQEWNDGGDQSSSHAASASPKLSRFARLNRALVGIGNWHEKALNPGTWRLQLEVIG